MSQGNLDPRIAMIREEVGRISRPAFAEAAERARRDLGGLPEDYDGLVPWFEVHPFGAQVGVKDIRQATGITCSSLPDGTTLSFYLARHRLWTALQILELGDDLIPTGRAAAEVGFKTYRTWCRVYQRVMGQGKDPTEAKIPPLIRRPVQLRPRFDALTWYLARTVGLPPGDVVVLLRRLRHRYPGVLSDASGARPFPPLPPGSRATRPGGIAGSAAELALELAAARPCQRLCVDGHRLPGKLPRVTGYAADHLLEKKLNVAWCCEQLDIHDKSISTQILFHLGESLPDLFERRRIEVALPLVAGREFTIRQIARKMGMSYDHFLGVFEERTGIQPGEIRDLVAATCDEALHHLWHGVEGGGLKPAEVRVVASYLRGSDVSPPAPQVVVSAAPPPPALAVRRDVDARDVRRVLLQYRMTLPEGLDDLMDLVTSHARFSAAQSYAEWVRDRLGRPNVELAWVAWEKANERLAEVLKLPHDEQLAVVARDRDCQSDAFLWLLIDCVGARLFHDAAESEHFADLAVAAADGRRNRECSAAARGLRALALALKANALRRRNELARASAMFKEVLGPPAKVLELVLGSLSKRKKPRPASRQVLRPAEADPWIVGRVCSLYASLLSRKGEERQALRVLAAAAFHFKEAGDEFQRVRCAVDRSSGWFAKGRDPSELLTRCIEKLERHPFAKERVSAVHLNRAFARIYLADQLTGQQLAAIKSLRAAVPPVASAYIAAQRDQIDGLIAALDNQPELAVTILEGVASWYGDRDLLGDAAACWLQYSWAVLPVDAQAAGEAAETAFAYMERTGFKSQGLHEVALKIYRDARQGELTRGLLRRGILLSVCPGVEARLASEAEPS